MCALNQYKKNNLEQKKPKNTFLPQDEKWYVNSVNLYTTR